MSANNYVRLRGNLGKDAELASAGGTPVLRFSLCTTDRYTDRSGQKQEKSVWHRVSLFGTRAETLVNELEKGTRVIVEGSITCSTCEKDGQKIEYRDISAQSVDIVRAIRMVDARMVDAPATNSSGAKSVGKEKPFDDDF